MTVADKQSLTELVEVLKARLAALDEIAAAHEDAVYGFGARVTAMEIDLQRLLNSTKLEKMQKAAAAMRHAADRMEALEKALEDAMATIRAMEAARLKNDPPTGGGHNPEGTLQ